MTDDFFMLFDSKYDRVYKSCYDTWQACEMIMTHSILFDADWSIDRILFEYSLYRHMAAAMRKGIYDMHRDAFIIIMSAAFYVLEVKGTDRYVEPVLTVLYNLRDDTFFTYSKKDFNDYVFTAAQIVGPQATAYALAKLDICQQFDTDGFEL